MKALLTTNYISTHLSYGTVQQHKEHKVFKNWIEENKGKWVEIDTNSLFNNQYNTVDGHRIYDTYIDEIKEDVRHHLYKCGYCGKTKLDTEKCEKYEECKTAKKDDLKNSFFVKHPKGKDKISSTHEIEFKDHRKNERFLSCYSCLGSYYRISRRSTIEFILVGSEIFISNSIGYTPLKKSRLSSNEIDIVKYCANRILTNKF